MCKLWSSVHSSQFTVLSSQFIDSYETKGYSDDVKRTCREHLTCAMSINAYSSQKLENLEPDHKEK
jgi:hypothetical protein